MADTSDADFEALAERLLDPATTLPPAANVSVGEKAAAAGSDFLLSEYGSEAALDAALRPAGRPRLGERPKGASPTVRGRIPEAERAAFDQLMRQTGKRESELVREAVHLLLERHKLAS
ncbi:hypothetical protein [Leifsonia shinshuensis]|uniref:hypothetical protein n=1 Tax=Leifsonia shinshuensis TaxID=150026 RepID=UPI001CA4DC7A|nr:hypothetical protein [Leifsonia shinshuensis]